MAPRKVIADSEDEDEGDDVLLLHTGGEVDRPEPEPLSPHDRSLAVQQSHLIETIVRQSQRASAASSGDVSLPIKNKGRRVNPSSGTDVTSPRAVSRPRHHITLPSDDASELTTPRKSMEREWDVPSSPEEPTTLHSAGYSGEKAKTHSRNQKGRSGPVSSSPAAEPSVADESTPKVNFQEIGTPDHEGLGMDTVSMSVAGRSHFTHHDPVLPDATGFYIAQSNLTTMQKLEYQKVNVSMGGYGELPGRLSIQKSSGATTVPYSTPSGYSSAPPLPWEEPVVQPPSPQPGGIISIGSSPDVIGPGSDGGNETPVPNEKRESSVRPKSPTPISKGKKRPAQDFEEDELGRDDRWDPDDVDAPMDLYRPRATKRRSAVAADLAIAGISKDKLEDTLEEAVIRKQAAPDIPVPSMPDTDPPEPPPEAPPKKRGRKKKQPVIENPRPELAVNEDSYANQNPISLDKTIDAGPPLEKPKKKRGRPRKSDPSKTAEVALPESPVSGEPVTTNSLRKDCDPTEPIVDTEMTRDGVERSEREKNAAAEEVVDSESHENGLPLKEVDSNLKTPSKLASTVESPLETEAEPNDGKSTPKTQPRETLKTAASQSKLKYRVGLSKRSRIAPLLKTIKK